MLRGNINSIITGDSRYPVVTVDDPSVRQVPGDVLVLGGLNQAQLCDWPVLHGPHQADKDVLVMESLEVANYIHVLVLDLVRLPTCLLSEPEVERESELESYDRSSSHVLLTLVMGPTDWRSPRDFSDNILLLLSFSC